MKRLRFLALLALLLGLATPTWATVTVTLDHDQIDVGDTVQLTLKSDQRGSGQPDLSPLKKDFDILGRSTSNNLSIINGHVSSQRQFILALSPKHSGQIVVPPLSWDGEQSPPVTLTVASNGSGPAHDTSHAAGTASHVFVTTTLDNSHPYVQAAVIVKVRLYSDQPLEQASIELPGNGDVLVEHIGKDIQTQETRNGNAYQVAERTYVLFPQRSGAIQLDGPVLDAQVADAQNGLDQLMGDVFGQIQMPGLRATRPLRLHGDPIQLTVRPRPAEMGNRDWLPAQQITLEESWQPQDDKITAGQPITRHLRLNAIGLSAGQLPDLSLNMPLPPGLKAYPDQAKLNNHEQSGHIAGHRDQDIALIADHAGRYEIPAMRVSWWNTVTNQRQEAVLPSRSLEVSPGPGSGSTSERDNPVQRPIAPTPPISPSITDGHTAPGPAWMWVSLGMGFLWLGTLFAWAWTAHRRTRMGLASTCLSDNSPPTADTIQTTRQDCIQACRGHQPSQARDAILSWIRSTWPAPHPAGLNALARALAETPWPPLLRELDRACATGASWHGEALAQALAKIEPPPASQPAPHALPELYSDGNAAAKSN